MKTTGRASLFLWNSYSTRSIVPASRQPASPLGAAIPNARIVQSVFLWTQQGLEIGARVRSIQKAHVDLVDLKILRLDLRLLVDRVLDS